MPTIGDVYKALDQIAPFCLAESWDNAGLLLGGRGQSVTRILTALDVTQQVLDEAVEWGAQLIVTHHPVIFSPLKSIEAGTIVYQLIQRGIGVISAHTNLDIAEGGVNDVLAARLGLTNLRPLQETSSQPHFMITVTVSVLEAEAVYQAMAAAGAGTWGNYSHCGFSVKGEGRFMPNDGSNPYIGSKGKLEKLDEIRLEMLARPDKLAGIIAAMKSAHPYEEVAYSVYHNYGCVQTAALGRLGDIETSTSPQAFAILVKERLGLEGLRFVDGGQEVKTVAVCGGSGAELLWTAKELGAQALVTGECKHHLLIEAEQAGITLVDAGHFGTETVIMEPLCKRLEAILPGIPVRVANSNRDAAQYL